MLNYKNNGNSTTPIKINTYKMSEILQSFLTFSPFSRPPVPALGVVARLPTPWTPTRPLTRPQTRKPGLTRTSAGREGHWTLVTTRWSPSPATSPLPLQPR